MQFNSFVALQCPFLHEICAYCVYIFTPFTSSNPDAYYAHVGMVVNVSGNNITTVEGNLSDTITSPGTYNYATATHIGDNNFSVLGFATPNWN